MLVQLETFRTKPEANRLFGPVSLLVLQGTSLCNLACRYCYISQEVRSTPLRMSVETVRATVKHLVRENLLGRELVVNWHSGEPLTLPAAFYEERMVEFDLYVPDTTRVRHSIQTNATLLKDEHCDLFERRHVELGVSVDGPAFIHDLHRPTRAGCPTHAMVTTAIATLHERRIGFTVICVLSELSLRSPNEIYEYFRELGCSAVGFNLEEVEGFHRESSVTELNAAPLFSSFIAEFWRRLEADGFPFVVREFSDSQRRLLRSHVLRNGQTEPLININVASNGEWSTFCPELLDEKHPVHGSFRFGNVNYSGFREALSSAHFLAVDDEIQVGVKACRDSCEYFSVCYGGNPANKLAENQSLSSTETLNCRIRTQLLSDFMVDRLANGLGAPNR